MSDQRLLDLERRHAKERERLQQEILAKRMDEYRQLRFREDLDYVLVPIPKLTPRQLELLRFLAVPKEDSEFKGKLSELFGDRKNLSFVEPELCEIHDMVKADIITMGKPMYGLTELGKAVVVHYED